MYMLPRPYPDEIVGSMLQRAQRQLGIGRRSMMSKITGESLGTFSFSMTRYPKIAQAFGFEMSEFLQKHTLLPYQLTFVKDTERSAVLSSIDPEQTTSASIDTPFRRHVRGTDHWAKLCPDCLANDLKQYGEAYWHRAHQLYAVEVCTLHHTNLYGVEHEIFQDSLPPPPHEISLLGKVTLSSLPQSVKHAIAAASMKALNTTVHIDWTKSYQDRSQRLGYVYKTIYVDRGRFSNDVEQFFGTDFLEANSCVISGRSANGWPAKLLNTSTIHTSAFKHILLNVFLDDAMARQGLTQCNDLAPPPKA